MNNKNLALENSCASKKQLCEHLRDADRVTLLAPGTCDDDIALLEEGLDHAALRRKIAIESAAVAEMARTLPSKSVKYLEILWRVLGTDGSITDASKSQLIELLSHHMTEHLDPEWVMEICRTVEHQHGSRGKKPTQAELQKRRAYNDALNELDQMTTGELKALLQLLDARIDAPTLSTLELVDWITYQTKGFNLDSFDEQKVTQLIAQVKGRSNRNEGVRR